jgi:hypothetical protein
VRSTGFQTEHCHNTYFLTSSVPLTVISLALNTAISVTAPFEAFHEIRCLKHCKCIPLFHLCCVDIKSAWFTHCNHKPTSHHLRLLLKTNLSIFQVSIEGSGIRQHNSPSTPQTTCGTQISQQSNTCSNCLTKYNELTNTNFPTSQQLHGYYLYCFGG